MRGQFARFFGATGTALGGVLVLIAVVMGISQPLGCWVGAGEECAATGQGFLLAVGGLLVAGGVWLLIRSGLPAELRGEEPS